MANKLKTIATGLKLYYSAPLNQTFRQFRNGLTYFSFGFIVIYLAQTSLAPSLQQEILTFIGVLIVAIGFFMALMAHIRMIISRILAFFLKR